MKQATFTARHSSRIGYTGRVNWKWSVFAVGFVFCAASTHAQVIKPIDHNKVSEFDKKQFGAKEVGGKSIETKQYGKQGDYDTSSYTTREFSHSSKSFDARPARNTSKNVAAPDLPYKAFDKRDKTFEAKAVETKVTKDSTATARVADKPVTDWWNLIRKTPPTGVPGKPNDVPFSRWKIPDEEKKDK